MNDDATVEKLKFELRRGVLVMAVLARLGEEHCGYSLRKRLAGDGLAIDEGTLYPLLRRLESQELLSSEWRWEQKRKKRFYRLTTAGRTVLKRLYAEWKDMASVINQILVEEDDDGSD